MPGLREIRILIVDDNAQMRSLIRSVLRGVGIGKVFEAGGVEEGLEMLRIQPVDIVLLDFAMKPLDGLAFASRVRQFSRSPAPYVALIMMTCHAHISRVAAARDAGVNSFLAKPISGRSLVEHILAAINDGRPFVRAGAYFGPDRRRFSQPHYRGPKRRSGEAEDVADDLDIDEAFSAAPRTARAS